MTKQDTPAADPASQLPFSRPFHVDRLRGDGIAEIEVEANATERAALARVDGLVAVDRLVGRFRITHAGPNDVSVTGEVEAAIVQTCSVTLEPFEASVREAVDLRFAPPAQVAAAEAAAARAAEDGFPAFDEAPDPPDPIVDGQIDLGAIAAEFLALGLDPYPRKPGATFDSTSLPSEGQAVASPFAALQRLKHGKT